MTTVGEMNAAFEEYEKEDLQDELDAIENEIFELQQVSFRCSWNGALN